MPKDRRLVECTCPNCGATFETLPNKRKAGPQAKLTPCVQCGTPLKQRQRIFPCPTCGFNNHKEVAAELHEKKEAKRGANKVRTTKL